MSGRFVTRWTGPRAARTKLSTVVDAQGVALIKTAKVTEFDEWADKHFPDSRLFFAGQFAAQQSGGFAAMGKADRKTTVLRYIGAEHLQAKADIARRKLGEQEKALSAVLADARATQGTAMAVEDAEDRAGRCHA